ncbi:hypothetical protein dsx2_0486 [Desulfovibrio sp. X2]|uniref:hypothetical protein n=1 Tax=Desulfovibrio sp. X2 TaxID=941449 RepID=UPI0003587647|nr:hypothetical protein [Desulfovibrio sp. X2]EPR38677.1 hypothetical protein dsx2_0486 [Desulfovibrio sp. X2]
MSANPLHEKIRAKLLARVCESEERRVEAVREYLAVSCPGVQETAAANLADLVPPLLPELYAKWIGMFADRLLETVPAAQVEELCSGTRENDAALLLVFLMYLESATMERQMAEDLKAYGLAHSSDEDGGMIVANYIRARMAEFRKAETLH